MIDVLEIETCNELVARFETVIKSPRPSKSGQYFTGVDLGTACIVLAVLDEEGQPVAGAYRYADVVRDGMVVDYIGAVTIVRELKEEIESKLQIELRYAAAAIPPGTDALDSGAIKNVVQSAGFELTNLLDEPTAANQVLDIQNGAVVDIGGGTTGISIIKDGEVIKVADEATGGTHLTLVTAGAYKMSIPEAELFKRDVAHHQELLVTLKPVVEKIATIILEQVAGYEVDGLYLVGGTTCLTGIEGIIEKKTGIPTFKPINPMFVTPLGIALSCTDEALD
ncbi:ethanolamine utilization protein EutJ [Enterococcus asini]|uniref:ethanolamine utilization protein EutJ n=1 Tax=Enterococcus asini TaxID=57732 RepID=UPI0015F46202|nr:ethanolamine utilization protein EutJ [Enterococcus asini]